MSGRGGRLSAARAAWAGFFLLAFWPASPARAAQCSVSTVAVAFGGYDPRSATAKDGVGSLTVSCNGNPGAMTIASSTGQSGSFASRSMKAGSWTLQYQLYTNSGRTIVWGDGSGGSSIRSLAAEGTYTIWGRITALQNVGAGSYTDSIVLTLTF